MGGLNVKFEELLLSAEISDKGKYELKSIFYALTDDKKNKILQDFKWFITRIEIIEEEHRREQEFLLEQSMERIEQIVTKYEDKDKNIN